MWVEVGGRGEWTMDGRGREGGVDHGWTREGGGSGPWVDAGGRGEWTMDGRGREGERTMGKLPTFDIFLGPGCWKVELALNPQLNF